MQQGSHAQERNMRSTMPLSFTRASIQKVLEGQDKLEKSQGDHMMNSTNYCQSSSNCFFVRISKQSLEQQKRIYKWRMNCSDEFVSISTFKLQAEGNCYNPNLLFKVELPVCRSNFVQVKDICLTKCVNLLKSVLRSIQILFQYFQPVIFTEKMIYQTEEGTTKIWMDERFYINPNNELYCRNNKQVSVQKSLRSVIDIFQAKCLKTKLSSKLFSLLQKFNTVSDTLLAIVRFQSSQNLFPIQGLKVSVSTGTALNTSCSLEFSGSRSVKKRKTVIKSDKQIKIRNIASHKFLQAKSMELNPILDQSNTERDSKNTYQSQHESNESQSMGKSKRLLQVNPQKPAGSLVISEMFHSDSQLNKQSKSSMLEVPAYMGENSIRVNINIMKSSPKILQSSIFENEPKSQTITRHNERLQKEEANDEGQQQVMQAIISRNGWNPSITSLFDRKNVKQSMCQGRQQNLLLKNFKLKKLHTMGKDVRESVMPVHEEAENGW